MRDRAVACEVSERWLELLGTLGRVGDAQLLVMSVMTLDLREQPRELCRLALEREELPGAIALVRNPGSDP